MKARTWIVYLFTLATDFLGVVFALSLRAFGADAYRLERAQKAKGLFALTCDVAWLPGNYSAITIAPHVILYRRGRRLASGWSKLQDHEHRHSEQYEAAGMVTAFLALCALLGGVPDFMAILVYVVGPWADMGAGYAVAWLRGEDVYRGSHNEEAAHALAAEDDD